MTLKAFVKVSRDGNGPLLPITLPPNSHLSILHKLVYVPSLCKVGRVSQVRNGDHVIVEVAPSRRSKVICNGSSNEFSFRDVVDV